MKRIAWLMAAALLLAAGCMLPDAAEKAAARQRATDGALVVDVRSPKDFKAGHYAGATNIPFREIKNRCSGLGETNRPIVLYCVTGMSAGQAKKTLQAAGFTNVYNAGGISSLRK